MKNLLDSLNQQRLKENEIIFRKANESVAEFVEEQIGGDAAILPFYCECSTPECRQRIKISTKLYKQLHDKDRRFIALPGHDNPDIEKVIKTSIDFIVLEKFGAMPSEKSVDIALSQAAA